MADEQVSSEGIESQAQDSSDIQGELERLKQENTRYREQVAGSKRMFEAAREAGFDSIDSFKGLNRDEIERARKLSSTAKERNLDLDALMGMMSGGGREAEEQSLDADSLRSELLEQLKGEVHGEISKGRAEDEHSRRHKEIESRLESYLGELGDMSDARKKWNQRALRAAIDEASALYDEGHPLRESHLRPPDDEALAKVFEEYKQAYAEERGAELEKKAEAAKRGGTRTVAGNADSEGKPTDEKPKGRPGGLPAREDVEAAYEKLQKQRSKGSVSSLG